MVSKTFDGLATANGNNLAKTRRNPNDTKTVPTKSIQEPKVNGFKITSHSEDSVGFLVAKQ
jgi:hypothetical protein